MVTEVDRVVAPILRELSDNDLELHEAGYHAYSTAVSRLRSGVESAYMRFVDEVMPS